MRATSGVTENTSVRLIQYVRIHTLPMVHADARFLRSHLRARGQVKPIKIPKTATNTPTRLKMASIDQPASVSLLCPSPGVAGARGSASAQVCPANKKARSTDWCIAGAP